MSPDRLEHFRSLLKELEAEVRQDLEENSEDAATVQLDSSIGRLSRMDAMQSQQMALELRRRQGARLQRIAQALKDMDSGTYGICRVCRHSISEDRLEFQPDAGICVPCLEKR